MSTRPRMLGGSTSAWGSFLTPLDASDFVARPSVPLSGWPFTIKPRSSPTTRRAHGVFGLGPAALDYAQLWPLFGAAPHAFDPERLHVQSLAATRLAVAVPADSPLALRYCCIAQSSRRPTPPCVCCSTRVSASIVSGRGRASTSRNSRCAARRTRGARVTARAFVLAAGAIENARLLLDSRARRRPGRVAASWIIRTRASASALPKRPACLHRDLGGAPPARHGRAAAGPLPHAEIPGPAITS